VRENIIKGTLILSITSIIIRSIGFVFRIYLANTIGAEGIGLYQLIMAFYMLTITLATSGIGVAVSRIVAEEIAKNKPQNVKKALRMSIVLSLITSGLATLILFFGAEYISINILKDARAILPLQCLAPSLPFLAFSACYRGYFHGARNIVKPSSAQVLEQIVRILVTIWLLRLIEVGDVVQACSVAMIGMTAGEVISYIYIWILYRIDSFLKKSKANKTDKMLPYMLSISMPVAGSSYLHSILRLVENTLIPIKLIASGMTVSTAMSIYGIIKGMVLPILFFPTSFLSSLAAMLLPSLSSDNVNKNDKHMTYTLSKVLHFTSISGILVVSFFLLFPYEIGDALYTDIQVGSLIRILSFLCPFMYLNVVIGSLLNALNEQVNNLKIHIIESAIKILMIFFLVPIYGFKAYLLALFITTILNTILYMYRLLKVSYLIFDVSNWVFKPMMAATISGLTARIFYIAIFKNMFSSSISLVITFIIIVLIYTVLLFISKGISNSDFDTLKRAFAKKRH
jgi:stage V sporulation protein B